MFDKTRQKQEPIKNTKLSKIMGTNNEGNIQEYKPHVKSKSNKLIIIKNTTYVGKANINNNKKLKK